MKFIRDKAIIIECINIQRSDRLVSFFTYNHGMVKGIAEAARQMKSRFLPCFELLNLVEITYVQKENKELVTIQECEVTSSLAKYGEKQEYYFFLFYIAELAKEFGLEGYKNTRLFSLITDVHNGIKKNIKLKIMARWAELQFLNEHGIFPDLITCTQCKKDLRYLQELKFISDSGEFKCIQCKNIDDFELQHPLFLLMNQLLYAKITTLNTLIIKDYELKQIGAILKQIMQKHLEKPLKFYGFYKQVYHSSK